MFEASPYLQDHCDLSFNTGSLCLSSGICFNHCFPHLFLTPCRNASCDASYQHCPVLFVRQSTQFFLLAGKDICSSLLPYQYTNCAQRARLFCMCTEGSLKHGVYCMCTQMSPDFLLITKECRLAASLHREKKITQPVLSCSFFLDTLKRSKGMDELLWWCHLTAKYKFPGEWKRIQLCTSDV